MSAIGEHEKAEFLQVVDSFFMAKLVHDEGLSIGAINHHDMYQGEVFLLALDALLEKYPYFKIRLPKNNQNNLCVITVSLPRSLKSHYKWLKNKLVDAIEKQEIYIGDETHGHRHYNEIHLEVESEVFFQGILTDMIKAFRELKKKEGVLS